MLLAWLVVLLPVTRLAAADEATPDKAACAESYEQAQEQRKTDKLLAARESLLVCSQPTCPEFIKSDCVRWLPEVDAVTPSLAVRVKDEHGVDLVDVRVLVDGKKVADRLNGMALPVDPGAHELTFEHGDATPIVRKVLLREGEKARVVDVRFAAPSTPAAAKPTPARAPAYVFGVAGVIGLGVGSYFWVDGKRAEADAKSQCAPACPQDRSDSIRSRYLAGDIAVGAGLVSLGVATFLFLRSAPHKERAVGTIDVDVRVARGSGIANVSGRF